VSSRTIEQDQPPGGAEALARGFPGEWLVIRSAPVYGVTDDPLSLFLILMRSLPAVPILSDTHLMQPLWHEDLARALAAGPSLDAAGVNRVVQVAGPETVTQDQLYERLARLTDRRPLRIPLPDFVAAHGAALAGALHLSVPLEGSHLAFTEAASPELAAADNALSALFGVTATSLEAGLTRLVHQLAEVTPSEGVGTLEVKRFSARIHGSRYDAAELLTRFRMHFEDVMPIPVGVEPVAPRAELVSGKVVTMALPGRGHVQVRVEEVTDTHVVVATLRGHALAGVVKFSTRTFDDSVGFEVMPCDTAANALDWLTLTLGGAKAQDANWISVVQNVVKLAGGTADPVHTEARKLAGGEAEQMQQWIRGLIQRQRERQDAAESAIPRG
jgi:NADH dehydrogenase